MKHDFLRPNVLTIFGLACVVFAIGIFNLPTPPSATGGLDLTLVSVQNWVGIAVMLVGVLFSAGSLLLSYREAREKRSDFDYR